MKSFSSLKDLVYDIFEKRGWHSGLLILKLTKEWAGMLEDKAVAEKTRPVAIKSGVLFVEVDDNFLLFELSSRKAKLLEKINNRFSLSIRDIKFFTKT